MHKILKKTIRATIINVIVALFITFVLLLTIYLFCRAEIDETISIIGKISTDTEQKVIQETIINEENKIQNYPEYGTQYATIEIPKINVTQPVYFGSTLDILKKGVGHDSGSYFPGEGGSIIYMGHNSKNVFRNFSQLEIGDKIIVNATYGEFEYQIYDMKLINETELDELPIQKDKEILMVYTCYPFNNIGYATQRYVVYSELVN